MRMSSASYPLQEVRTSHAKTEPMATTWTTRERRMGQVKSNAIFFPSNFVVCRHLFTHTQKKKMSAISGNNTHRHNSTSPSQQSMRTGSTAVCLASYAHTEYPQPRRSDTQLLLLFVESVRTVTPQSHTAGLTLRLLTAAWLNKECMEEENTSDIATSSMFLAEVL